MLASAKFGQPPTHVSADACQVVCSAGDHRAFVQDLGLGTSGGQSPNLELVEGKAIAVRSSAAVWVLNPTPTVHCWFQQPLQSQIWI